MSSFGDAHMSYKVFFAAVRENIGDGRLSQAQVDGLNLLMDTFNETYYRSRASEKLAYILATVWHETGTKMTPVRESFAETDAEARRRLHKYAYAASHPTTGHAYYGRGFVQITWFSNYERVSKLIGEDLVNKPDLALDPNISALIAVNGMREGWFTGRKLHHYFNDVKADPIKARAIINGTDRADIVAAYYEKFLDALKQAEYVSRQ